jgi:hypothetical protein
MRLNKVNQEKLEKLKKTNQSDQEIDSVSYHNQISFTPEPTTRKGLRSDLEVVSTPKQAVEEEQSSPTASSIDNFRQRKFSRGSFSPLNFIKALRFEHQIKDYPTS